MRPQPMNILPKEDVEEVFASKTSTDSSDNKNWDWMEMLFLRATQIVNNKYCY